MKITDDSTKAAAIIDLQISKQEQYDAKNLQLKTFMLNMKSKLAKHDSSQLSTQGDIQLDIDAIAEYQLELEANAALMADVKSLSLDLAQCQSINTNQFELEFNNLESDASNIMQTINLKQGEFQASYSQWDLFLQAGEESRACILELKSIMAMEEPVGPELEQQFELLSNQRQYVYDTCQSSVAALTTLSNALIDRAGPDAMAIVLSGVGEIQGDWEESAEASNQQAARMQASLTDWSEFNVALGELLDWVHEADSEVSTDIPVITGGNQLQQLHDKQQMLKGSMEQKDALYEAVCDKGSFYINNCNNPELERTLDTMMDSLDTKWRNVENKLPSRSENLECLLSTWLEIEEGARELKEWLRDAEVVIPGDDLSVSTGNVDDTAADLIRYKNFTEELKERQCHLHDLKQKLDIIEVDDTSDELGVLFETIRTLDTNLEVVQGNTLSWRQNLESSANLWNPVSGADDSMIAQELSKLSDQQCLLQDAVTNLNMRVVDALNQPKADSPWCWRILRWLLILLFLYFIFFAIAAWMPDRGCPGRTWKWWDAWTPRLTLRSYRPLPH